MAINERRESHAGAKLRHGVFFVEKIDVGLHRGGLLHHALAERADFGHVRPHDAVAFFRHPLDFLDAAHRLHAEAEKNDIERFRTLRAARGYAG